MSGARRQENRWDPTDNEQVVPETRETSRKLFDDAMFKLEHKNNDVNVSKKSSATLNRLLSRQEDVWKDDFAANSFLRARFRVSFISIISVLYNSWLLDCFPAFLLPGTYTYLLFSFF